jgi:hypothetical protein
VAYEIDLPKDPQEFVSWARNVIGVGSDHPFYYDDIESVVAQFGLLPSAYLLEHHHWNFVLETRPNGLVIYNPVSGLEDRQYSSRDAQRVFYFKEGQTSSYGGVEALRINEQHHYSINAAPLWNLGPTMQRGYDCGPLAIYAARIALNP